MTINNKTYTNYRVAYFFKGSKRITVLPLIYYLRYLFHYLFRYFFIIISLENVIFKTFVVLNRY